MQWNVGWQGNRGWADTSNCVKAPINACSSAAQSVKQAKVEGKDGFLVVPYCATKQQYKTLGQPLGHRYSNDWIFWHHVGIRDVSHHQSFAVQNIFSKSQHNECNPAYLSSGPSAVSVIAITMAFAPLTTALPSSLRTLRIRPCHSLSHFLPVPICADAKGCIMHKWRLHWGMRVEELPNLLNGHKA